MKIWWRWGHSVKERVGHKLGDFLVFDLHLGHGLTCSIIVLQYAYKFRWRGDILPAVGHPAMGGPPCGVKWEAPPGTFLHLIFYHFRAFFFLSLVISHFASSTCLKDVRKSIFPLRAAFISRAKVKFSTFARRMWIRITEYAISDRYTFGKRRDHGKEGMPCIGRSRAFYPLQTFLQRASRKRLWLVSSWFWTIPFVLYRLLPYNFLYPFMSILINSLVKYGSVNSFV